MTVDQILVHLDNHGFTKFADTLKLDYLNDIYFDVCTREAWPFMEKTTDINTVGSTSTLAVASDYSKTVALANTTTGYALQPERLDTITKRYASSLATTGKPTYYYFVGEALHLYPIPDGIYAMRHRYVAKPTALAEGGAEATILLPPRHHMALIDGTVGRLHALDSNFQGVEFFTNRFEKRIQTMREDVHKRQYDRPEVVEMVDIDDYFESPEG